MGLVGFVLVPMAAQVSVDYLDTREFAMRPRQWLSLMTKTRATISFAPSFGYDLCARRVRANDIESYDLSNWRVAGIGAEMIRPQTLEYFADIMEPCGFDRRAFLACYGMAECTLGISFSPLWTGFTTHHIDSDQLSDNHQAVLMDEDNTQGRGRHFVNCGVPLPDFEVEVRDDDKVLGDWQSGVIHLRGPSVMSGYYNQPDETRQVLCDDGWLNTGDIGYVVDGNLTITGRKKDLIITAGGKNVAPQYIERVLKLSPYISQAAAYGDRRKYLTALITLDSDVILPWARENGLGERTIEQLASEPAVQRLITVEVERLNGRLARYETIKRFWIVPGDFSVDGGELTPTMKPKRRVVSQRYGEVIEGLYAS